MTAHNDIEQLELWIGGEHTPSSSGRYFDDLDPTDDSVYCRVAQATAEDMDRAVRTAHEAFQSYRQTTPRHREQWLARAADIIERDRESIADTIVTENGSPISKARFETMAAADYIRSAAGITRRIVGETHPSDNPGRMVMSVREPLGVVGSITPFNVPFLKAAKLSAGALATGNTVVGLASEFTPKSVLLMGRVYEEAGFPSGTFNVITGFGADIGDSLTTPSVGEGHPVHRLKRHRQAHFRPVRPAREALRARARRQEPFACAGGRGRGRRRGGRRHGVFLLSGPGLHGDQPGAGGAADLRRVCGETQGQGRARRAAPDGRPARPQYLGGPDHL